MQLNLKRRFGFDFVGQTNRSESRTNLEWSFRKAATKLGLVAVALVVSSTGCRSGLNGCPWHQRGVRMHPVRYRVPTACSRVGEPVPLPAALSNSPAAMMGGNGVSEQVPMYRADQAGGDWPGEPAVDVAPVPRDWSGGSAGRAVTSNPGGPSAEGMADVPEAIEVPDSGPPPVLPTPESPTPESPTPDSPAIEL